MGLARDITDRVVGSGETSFSATARRGRWRDMLEAFPDLPSMRVLDVGGETEFWTSHVERPAAVVMVNPVAQDDTGEDWIGSVVGDGCALPTGLGSFDLAISNSVIEHVGGHARRIAFASEIRDAAPNYWVQTPYRYFPIEPHFVFPFFQHLPAPARSRIAQSWPVGNFAWLRNHPDRSRLALEYVQGAELIGITEMQSYFPDAEIRRERFSGLIKSIVAVHREK